MTVRVLVRLVAATLTARGGRNPHPPGTPAAAKLALLRLQARLPSVCSATVLRG